MRLTFENVLTVGEGHSPTAIHDKDNKLLVLYLAEDNTVHGFAAVPLLGLYNTLVFTEQGRLSTDENVFFPSIKRAAHYGAFGFWSGNSGHRFVVYYLPTDISKALIDGQVQRSIGSDSTSFGGKFVNVRGELLNRYRALVTPGTKLEVYFSIGDTAEIPLGVFYIDRAWTSYPDGEISINARNAVGKLLKEQTFDETTTFDTGALHDNIQEIMELAGVERYFIGDGDHGDKLDFEADTTILAGLEYVISLLTNWKIEETVDGVVGIAPADDLRFDQPSIFNFQRDKTCWSYDVEYDDSDAAARVCVYAEGTDETQPTVRVFVAVPFNKWWTQPAHRTFFVKTADGSTQAQCYEVAQKVAASLAVSGRKETFAGIFTPQLILGDEVRIAAGNEETIGSVTDITHNFGRGGFLTSFTVDSGGRQGRARLNDLIKTAAAFPQIFTGKRTAPLPPTEVIFCNSDAFAASETDEITATLSMMNGTLAIAAVCHDSEIRTAPSGWTLLHTSEGIRHTEEQEGEEVVVIDQQISVFYKFTADGTIEGRFTQKDEGRMFVNISSFSNAGIPVVMTGDGYAYGTLFAISKPENGKALWCVHCKETLADTFTVTGVGENNITQMHEAAKLLTIFDATNQNTITFRRSDSEEMIIEYFAVGIPAAE